MGDADFKPVVFSVLHLDGGVGVGLRHRRQAQLRYFSHASMGVGVRTEDYTVQLRGGFQVFSSDVLGTADGYPSGRSPLSPRASIELSIPL